MPYRWREPFPEIATDQCDVQDQIVSSRCYPHFTENNLRCSPMSGFLSRETFNSVTPEVFRNVGMTYMLGSDWRRYFKYIVVSAKKPTFFHEREPFRYAYS